MGFSRSFNSLLLTGEISSSSKSILNPNAASAAQRDTRASPYMNLDLVVA